MPQITQWPPIGWLWQQYKTAAAWYSGDARRISGISTSPNSFWASGEEIRFHVPLAADISSMSAAMIFSESPKFTTEHEQTQQRIDEVTELGNFYAVLLQAAELASAFGGVCLKWSWDIADGFPQLVAVPADACLPEWVNGKLKRITFWSVVREDENTGAVWRLREVYDDDGHIRSGLMRGSLEEIGTEQPLNSIEETRGIKPDVNSGTGMLLATYVPNMLPNRDAPHLRFGRSDYQGIYGMFDALDEAYSSIQRETRHTKTTVIVPMEYLRKREAMFEDMDTRASKWTFANASGVFTALDIDSRNTSSPMTVVNPEIRADARLKVCDDLVRRILSAAGYAPQSAGIDINGSAESGTALTVRERKTLRTTETKKTYWWHALMDMMRAFLVLDKAVFKSQVDPNAELSIELPSNTQPDIQQMSDILERLERAGAVSIQTKVQLLHPEWSEDAVQEEIERIRLERGKTGPDPLDPGLGDFEQTEEEEEDDGEEDDQS